MHEVLLGHVEIWWREERIYHYSEDIIKHSRNDTSHKRTTQLQTGVSVALYYGHFHVLIDHEVVSEYFKRVLTPLRVNFCKRSVETISH